MISLPSQVGVQGQALVTHGLEVNGLVSGIGLVTNGLLWPDGFIWVPCDYGITTDWTACEPDDIVTDWTACDAGVVTTWTAQN